MKVNFQSCHIGYTGRKVDIMKVLAMVHSLKDLAEVEIIEHKDNNNVIAEYNGKKCTAIFNPFVGRYYVDDIYGKIES